MIGISKLYCGAVEPGDVLRYNRESASLPSHLLQFSEDKKPVVVWNMTRRCNLKCIHCYAGSQNIDYPDELTTEEAKTMIADLAAFGSPGDPLLRRRTPDARRPAGTGAVRRGPGDAGRHLHERHPDHGGEGAGLPGDRPFLCRRQPGRHGSHARPLPGRSTGPSRPR